MRRQYLIIFLNVIFLFNLGSGPGISTLKSNELCFKKTNDCDGTHAYGCEKNICAFNHSSCESYKALNYVVKLSSTLSIYDENTLGQLACTNQMKKRLKLYKKILNNIQNCL